MTVKMTSAKSRSLVILMTLVMVQSVPLDSTTSRYNEENLSIHDTNFTYLPQNIINIKVPQISDTHIPMMNRSITSRIDRRISKSPMDDSFHSEELLRNLRDGKFDSSNFSLFESKEESRIFKNKKDSELYSNFIRNSIEDLRTPNKTLKINSLKSLTSKKIKLATQSQTELYGDFIKNTFRDTQILKPTVMKTSVKKYDETTNAIHHIKNDNIGAVTPGPFKIKLQKATTPPRRKIITITNKPIVLKLTKVPAAIKIPPTVTRTPQKPTRTPGWISKIKSTTYSPLTSTKKAPPSTAVYSWPNGLIKNEKDFNRYKNYTDLFFSSLGSSKAPNSSVKRKTQKPNTTSSKIKKKPKPNRVKYTPKPGHRPTAEEIKQNWYESGVPYPNPMPEISSNSPTFSIADAVPPQPIPENLYDPESVQVDASEGNPLTNVISNFNLDMLPSGSGVKNSVGGISAGSGCPTVHISSSVLSPQQRQECSDLNLVINSHFHQNTASDRTPTVDTYQAGNPEEEIAVDAIEEPAEDAGQGLADSEGVPQADPGFVQADSGGNSGGSSGGPGGSGSSGGSGGNGGDGDDGGGLSWPDMKGILDTLDWIGNKFGHLFNFFKNPYLYLIPAALFFLLGFVLVIALFPWWVPLLLLYVGVKAKHKPNIVHHKHIHKAVHHPDGWFWNHNTKSWENVQDYLHRKKIDTVSLNHIPQAIDHFGKKYGYDTITRKSIKRSRRSIRQS